MATLFRPFTDLWQRLTMGQRAGLVLTVGVAAAIIAGAVNYSTKPVYTTLYAGLNSKDASKITDELRDKKVPYELSSDGSTVKVPEPQVNQLRLDFAGKGMPTSGDMGYELFDKPMLGMTDFMQKMNYQRALEGELARMVSQLDAVEKATVHLVVPTPKLFEEDKKPATASIIVSLKANSTLSNEQVQGIAYLTAYSVEGLDVSNITIVDTKGNMLSSMQGRDQMAGMTSTQLDMQRKIEKDLENKALAMLQNVLGLNKAQVRISAKLNWNRLERTTENYDPDRTATLSEERQESTGDANSGNSERSVTNNLVPKTVEKYVPEVGNIERITASVIVDGNYSKSKAADGKDSVVYTDRSPQELEKFKSLVAAAIGIDGKRADELTVLSMPMSLNQEPEAAPTDTSKLWMVKLVEKIVLALMVIMLFLLIRSLISKVGKSLPALPAGESAQMQLAAASGEPAMMLSEGAIPTGYTPAQAATAATIAAQQARVAAGLAPETEYIQEEGGGSKVVFKQKNQTLVFEDEGPSVESLKHNELLKRATEYVIKKPENATQILRSWIVDESNEKRPR